MLLNTIIIVSIYAIVYLMVTGSIIIIHEVGHFMVGWCLGIPRHRMSIQILGKGAHVALIDDDGTKVSPDQLDRYVELLENHLPKERHMYFYVMGGHVFELIFIVALAIFALISDIEVLIRLSSIVIWLAFLYSTIYLLMDIISSLRMKKPSGGDFSGLWELAPLPTIIFYSIYFTTLVAIFILIRTAT